MIIDLLARSNQGLCVVFSVDAGFAGVCVTKLTAPSRAETASRF